MASVPLDDATRASEVPKLETGGWKTVKDRDALNKTFLFKDFVQAWSFMSSIALSSEKMDHHPEWFNVYNKVEITWSTHDCGGLSAKDIKMATLCNEVAAKLKS